VFEDITQVVGLIKNGGMPDIGTPEHARHVIEFIEAGYRAARTGVTQDLKTTFDPLPIEKLAEWKKCDWPSASKCDKMI